MWSTITNIIKQLGIEELGWNLHEVVETHQCLSSFAEDCNTASIEAYDAMQAWRYYFNKISKLGFKKL